jgi:hypothetical protein
MFGKFYRNQGLTPTANSEASSSKNSELGVRYGSARDLQRKVLACFCGSPPTVTEFLLLVTSLRLLYATAVSSSFHVTASDVATHHI